MRKRHGHTHTHVQSKRRGCVGGRIAWAAPTLVEVAMTYAGSTRLSGTPLTLNGPDTKMRPDGRFARCTTRFPLNLPDRRMHTAPGWSDARNLVLQE
jgi:hypothetical protein